jgi:anti-anti-sigma factor
MDGLTSESMTEVEKTDERGSTDLVRWEQTSEDAAISHLRGVIDATAVDSLEKSIETRLSDQPKNLLFDLRAVEYISSSGWGLFSKYQEICSAWGGRVLLCSLSEDLYEIYRYLEFHALIPVFASKEEALAHITGVGVDEAPPATTPEISTADAEPAMEVERTDTEDLDVEDAIPIDDILDAPIESGDASTGEATVEAGISEEEVPYEEPFEEEPAVEEPIDGEPAVEDEPAVEEPFEEEPAVEEPIDGEPAVEDEPAVEEPFEEEPVVEEPVAEDPVSADPRDEEIAPEESPDEEVPAEEPSLDETPPQRDYRFVDKPGSLDVDSAVSDKNISEDADLRRLGWAKYGEQLRRKRKKDDEE